MSERATLQIRNEDELENGLAANHTAVRLNHPPGCFPATHLFLVLTCL